MQTWSSISDGERIEVGLVQIDIAGHSAIAGSDHALQNAKSIFKNQIQSIATSRNGRLLSWAGDGGSFIFLTGGGEGFDNLVFSAIQMYQNMAAINQEIAIRTDLATALDVRISCHTANVKYSAEPSLITASSLNNFLKHERTVGLINAVIVTDLVFGQIAHKLRDWFVPYKPCSEVNAETFRYGWAGRIIAAGVPHLLHHVSLPVRNLERSVDFYRKLLECEPLSQAPSVLSRRTYFCERPDFPFGGTWFAMPNGQQLPLVLNPDGTFRTSSEIKPRDCHFAFRVRDFRCAQARLTGMGRPFLPDPLSMGCLQLYFVDDDNHVIELNADF